LPVNRKHLKVLDDTTATQATVGIESNTVLTDKDVISGIERYIEEFRQSATNSNISKSNTQTLFIPIPKKKVSVSGPVKLFSKIIELWELDKENASRLLGFEDGQMEYVSKVLDGEEPLRSKDAKDRIIHMFKIRQRINGLFKDLEVENKWLREPILELDNNTPLNLMLSGSMEKLLLIRQFIDRGSGF